MRVLIDADGCPVVRETVRQCAAFHVPCLLFCDTAHVFSIPGVEVFVADCGHDSTDYLLLSHLRPGDVVITQDYGLAALCLARSAQALHPAGGISSWKTRQLSPLSSCTSSIGSPLSYSYSISSISHPRKPAQDQAFSVLLCRILSENTGT